VNETKEEELIETVYSLLTLKDGWRFLREGDPGYEEAARLLGSHAARTFGVQKMRLVRWADSENLKPAPHGSVADGTQIKIEGTVRRYY